MIKIKEEGKVKESGEDHIHMVRVTRDIAMPVGSRT